MTPGRFYILISMGAALTSLTLAETGLYQFWEEQLEISKELQAKIPYADRVDAFTEALVRRVATESLRDPQIAALLKRQSVKVTLSPPVSSLPPAPMVPAAATPPPAAPINPAPTVPTLSEPPAMHP